MRALLFLRAAYPARPRTILRALLDAPVNPLRRDDVIRAAFQDDEGFQIVGEELLEQVLDVLRYERDREGGIPGVPHMLRLLVSVRAGTRATLQARDLDAIQERMTTTIRRALRRLNAQVSRDRDNRSHVEVYRHGHQHGWRLNIPIVAFT